MFLESRCPVGMGNRDVGDHFRRQSWPSLLPVGTIRRSAVPIFNLTRFACRVMTSLTIRMAAVPPLTLHGPPESHSAHRRPLRDRIRRDHSEGGSSESGRQAHRGGAIERKVDFFYLSSNNQR